MLTFLNKLLSLTWIGEAIEKLNGHKTAVSIIGFVLSGAIILIPTYFPELRGVSEVAIRIQGLLIDLGLDLQVINGISAAGVILGASHKVVKRLESA